MSDKKETCYLACSAYCNGSSKRCKVCKEDLSPNAFTCANEGGSIDTCDECLTQHGE